jgi:hypothetical protein
MIGIQYPSLAGKRGVTPGSGSGRQEFHFARSGSASTALMDKLNA